MNVCNQCDKQFRDQYNLNRHLECCKINLPEKLSDFGKTCQYCEKQFSSPSYTRKHQLACMVKIKNKKETNICKGCNHFFARKDVLKKHVEICKELICDF